jgi:hypothetical protein
MRSSARGVPTNSLCNAKFAGGASVVADTMDADVDDGLSADAAEAAEAADAISIVAARASKILNPWVMDQLSSRSPKQRKKQVRPCGSPPQPE